MGAKYFFFTDPDVLSVQAAPDAYGPTSPVGGNDLFRLTDSHTFTATASVFAICDGLICAQHDNQNTLTLILKPAEQPPFDFPAISYILYKGVDPASLLDSNGDIDAGQTGNDLVAAIRAAWELPANNNGTSAPAAKCLGLHLNPMDYPQTDNPARFADTEPLDRLFYDGDHLIQLPLVRGGWKLGHFAAGASGGMEIVVERIGYRPRIALARAAVNVLTVASLDPTVIYASNDATAFGHWHAKEECLNFIDPCALWGSFFAASLRVRNGSAFDKLTGNAIYEMVLGGTGAGAANFANRNRAYVDLRNEHGQSLDYYKADGPNIQFTLDVAADIDTCEVNYYGSGWPCFWVGNSSLPAGITGDRIDARLALAGSETSDPLIYLSAGHSRKLKRLKENERFLDCWQRQGSPYLEETTLTLPLVSDGGAIAIQAGYQKAIRFRQRLADDGQGTDTPDPNSLLLPCKYPVDGAFPLVDVGVFTGATATQVLVGDDEAYMDSGSPDAHPFVGRIGIARDASNAYLLIAPVDFQPGRRPFFLRRAAGLPARVTAPGNFLARFLARRLSKALVTHALSAGDQGVPPANVNVIETATRNAPRMPAALDHVALLSLTATELSQAWQMAVDAQSIDGTARLCIQSRHLFSQDGQAYAEMYLALSCLAASGSTVSRIEVSTSLQVFARV